MGDRLGQGGREVSAMILRPGNKGLAGGSRRVTRGKRRRQGTGRE